MTRSAALLDWYAANGRDLPWRDVSDPYLVLVSEVMLQQTQASRVVPYFERFVSLFPSCESLAEAALPEVLAAWSGLGYNSRTKRLKSAARMVTETGWPDSIDGLMALPGVGPYTAAAIACFALGEHVAAVDTNARRVISRWRGVTLDGKALRVAASEELTAPAAEWNQAIMDLGAMICRPASPRCDICPTAAWCCGPAAYEPAPRQARFEGSTRQARGAVVKALLDDTSRSELCAATGLTADRVEAAIDGLVKERLVAVTPSGEVVLADT